MMHRTVITVALSFGLSLPSAFAQQQTAVSRDSLLQAAREIMTTARYCALITLSTDGRAHARIMDPFLPDSGLVVHLGTNALSRKVGEIRRDPRVTLFYFDRAGAAYVSLYGTAVIEENAEVLQRWWKKEWQAFYPEREKTYRVITVRPQRLEVVSEKHGILGDTLTWAVPAVDFESKDNRDPARK